MKNSIVVILSFISLTSFADQGAVWSCKKNTIELKGEATYHGESGEFSQTLYTLSDITNSGAKAFFLTNTFSQNKDNSETISGRNAKGGSFTVVIKNIKDIGDGSVIQEMGEGLLTYHHGQLQGKDEKVECLRE